MSDGSDLVFWNDEGNSKRAAAPVTCVKFTYNQAEKQAYQKILTDELAKNTLFSQGWNKAKQILAANPAKKDGLEENEFLAVYTYTLPSPLVATTFNEKTRTLGPKNPNYDFKAMYYFLSAAINKISPKTLQKVYRGVTYPVTATVGQPFIFPNFASTTDNEMVAEIFSGAPDPGTMFYIQTSLGANIDRFSAVGDEDEVLIPPCEKFQVLKVQDLGKGRKAVHLKSTGMAV